MYIKYWYTKVNSAVVYSLVKNWCGYNVFLLSDLYLYSSSGNKLDLDVTIPFVCKLKL